MLRARSQGSKNGLGCGIIAESLANVGKTIDVAGSKNKAAAQLKRVHAEFVLMMAGGAHTLSALGVITAEDVQQVGGAQIGNPVGLAQFVDQKWKRDAGLFAKNARVIAVSEADDRQGCAFVSNGLFVVAQLRDMLATENSAIVTEENNDGGFALPERAETHIAVIRIGEHDAGELLAESFFHAKP